MKKYDLDLLKEQCGHDKTFFNEMIDVFIKSTLEGIDKLQDAMTRNDQEQMGHYAHKIVSPCRHIEAQAMISLLKEIESKADEKALTPERAEFLVNEVKREAGELIESLKKEYF